MYITIYLFIIEETSNPSLPYNFYSFISSIYTTMQKFGVSKILDIFIS